MRVAFNTLGDAERIAALTRGAVVKGARDRMIVADAALTPAELELQAATLARNYDAMFTKNGVPYLWPKKVPLGKYSFVDSNGVRTYVPFTAGDIERFGRSPYAKIKKGYKCPDKRLRQIIKQKSKNADKDAAKFPPTDPRHVRHIFPGDLFCKPEDESPLKNVAIAAVLVTGGIMLGPAIMAGAAKVGGGVAAVGGKVLGAAAKAAPLAEKVINGKAMTEAIKAGQMPGPPISIGDGSLTDYANVIGQKMLERDVARSASEAEKAELAWLIEAQRQSMAQYEQPHLPVVNSGLDPTLTAAQKTRADAAVGSNNLLKLLAVAVPVGLILWQRA